MFVGSSSRYSWVVGWVFVLNVVFGLMIRLLGLFLSYGGCMVKWFLICVRCVWYVVF